MAGNNLNRAHPVLDYTTADAESIINDMIAHAQANFPDRWTSYHPGGIAVIQLHLQAYQFDLLTFYLNGLLNETFVSTALRRNNLMKIARGVEYRIPSAVPFVVDMVVVLNPVGTYPATIAAANTQFRNIKGSASFTPIADTLVPAYGAGTVVVAASQGQRVTSELLGTSNGSRDQAFKLSQIGLLDDTLEVTVGGVPWTEVFNIVNSDSADEHYMVLTNDRGETTILFGDGQYGKAPATSNQIRASYQYLNAETPAGAVSHNTITQFTSGSGVILSVNNPAPATGGGPPPTLREVRAAIPASQETKNGLLHERDVAAKAVQVAGVAKARASEDDILFRRISLAIAPTGGGVPTSSLKSAVSLALRPERSLGLRTVIVDPTYKNVKMDLLVHAKANIKRDALKAALTRALINEDKTGHFDFPQMNFAGRDSDNQDDLDVSVDRLNSIADSLASSGLGRLEVRSLTVVAEARRLSSTSGDGTVTGVTTPTNDHQRREYLIRFTSAFTFVVKERIIGVITELQNNTLYDDSAVFPSLLTLGFTRLIPNRATNDEVPVTGNTTTLVSTSPTSASLFELAEIGDSYVLERDLPVTGTVGVPYEVTNDGATILQFTVNAGSSPWNSGDALILDTFAPIQDIALRDDEIPQLLEGNLNIQVSGGVA